MLLSVVCGGALFLGPMGRLILTVLSEKCLPSLWERSPEKRRKRL